MGVLCLLLCGWTTRRLCRRQAKQRRSPHLLTYWNGAFQATLHCITRSAMVVGRRDATLMQYHLVHCAVCLPRRLCSCFYWFPGSFKGASASFPRPTLASHLFIKSFRPTSSYILILLPSPYTSRHEHRSDSRQALCLPLRCDVGLWSVLAQPCSSCSEGWPCRLSRCSRPRVELASLRAT